MGMDVYAILVYGVPRDDETKPLMHKLNKELLYEEGYQAAFEDYTKLTPI